MGGLVVGADAQHDRIFLLDLGVAVTKAASLGGASGGVIFRIEIDDDALPPVVAEFDALTGIGGGFKICSHIPHVEFRHGYFLLLHGEFAW